MKRIFFIVILFLYSYSALATTTPERYDICVYGESASGVIAAVQAARMGKRVVLVSKNNHIGGMVTSGLTATDMNRNDMVGGVTKEFYGMLYDYYLDDAVWRNQTREEFMVSTLKRTYSGKNDERKIQWVYESGVAEALMRRMLDDAGVTVKYGARIMPENGVEKLGAAISSIKLDDGSEISARVFIDTTYEGDLMAAAGVEYIVGRESNARYSESCNGIRINYTQGLDLTSISPYADAKSGRLLPYVDAAPWGNQGDADRRTQAYCYRVTLTDDVDNMVKIKRPKGYNAEWYELLLRHILREPNIELKNIITFTPMPNRKTDTNHLDFFGASFDYAEASYAERAEIESLHKSYALGMMWFLANDKRVPESLRSEMKRWGLPKDEFCDTKNFPYQMYVREARRMVGEYVMTEHNVAKTKRVNADHSVGVGSYALDCHYVSRVVDSDGKLRNEGTIFQPTTPYPISYYALTPREAECSNLLVPVCLSASHVAYSTIRMEPVYMILGQSAATAAAMAIDADVAVQRVDYAKLRERLMSDGQILTTTKN